MDQGRIDSLNAAVLLTTVCSWAFQIRRPLTGLGKKRQSGLNQLMSGLDFVPAASPGPNAAVTAAMDPGLGACAQRVSNYRCSTLPLAGLRISSTNHPVLVVVVQSLLLNLCTGADGGISVLASRHRCRSWSPVAQLA